MSVRGKIEAVIYAAEEPVTLAQLAALFGAEALAESAQQGSAAQPPDAAGAGPEFPFADAEAAADERAQAMPSDAAIAEAVEHPEQVAATQPDGFAAEPDGARADKATEELDLEERRLARQKEREGREAVRRLLAQLIKDYDSRDRGVEIREIAGGYRVATRPEYHDAVRSFIKSLKPVMKLSLQALETLAVIAYKQPVTAPEVSEIRGVDSGGVLGSLISRKLVTTAGRKQVIGRPILYKTTKEFLLRFGLKDLNELPSMEEFEKMAGELVETEQPSQLALPAGQSPSPAHDTSQEERAMQASQQGDKQKREPYAASQAFPEEPAAAADVQAAPEFAEELEDEDLAARARASVQIDDETGQGDDLPGVTRDTAGTVNIDSSARIPSNGRREEDE